MKRSVEYYLGLPYSVELRREPNEGWFVRVREWPGCMSQADTAEEALANIQEVIPLWLEGALESDYEIPEPRGADDYSGRFMVRVPRLLHRSLAELAEREAISLNLLVNVALAEFIGQERPGKAGESPRDRAVLRSGFASAAAWSVTPKEATRRLGVVNEEKPVYNAAPTSKYAPLQIRLTNLSRSESYETLSFGEIEQIIGGKLPPSAHNHREWWSNHSGSHVQARAWLEAGWEVESVDQEARTVRFRRKVARDGTERIPALRSARAQAAVSQARQVHSESGANNLSAAEIESEIAQARRERRSAPAEE
jgi:antitoxin HicB